jgi:hypothetical protein
MIKKTAKQKTKQKVNAPKNYTVTYEYVPTEDAEERAARICKIIFDDLRKKAAKNSIICYCFNYSETDIEQDVIKNKGTSTILKKIKDLKKEGSCRCHETNPSGK